MKACIADTGALVALLDRADAHHDWAVDCFRNLRPPLFTCESVLAEALHLLSDLPASCEALARLHRDGVLRVDFAFETQAPIIWRLLSKYRDVPMDFADACLVRMTEVFADCVVWTPDSDFRVYRRHGRQIIPLLAPK
ncbi:MAG: type II toxin-antitoxin system VapC family toxin [Verrucomicrobiia bacterium]